jgi:predicted RNase H-like HicB family nuclease
MRTEDAMAVDLATDTRTEIILPRATGRVGGAQYTASAVFDGERWSALCRELDIASDGDTAAEALANVKNAVREALAVAAEGSVSPGQPVSDDDLRQFLTSHHGQQPVAGEVFFIW